jgi:hypothetical protein
LELEVLSRRNLSIAHGIPFRSWTDMLVVVVVVVVVVVGLDLRYAAYEPRHPLLVGDVPLA